MRKSLYFNDFLIEIIIASLWLHKKRAKKLAFRWSKNIVRNNRRKDDFPWYRPMFGFRGTIRYNFFYKILTGCKFRQLFLQKSADKQCLFQVIQNVIDKKQDKNYGALLKVFELWYFYLFKLNLVISWCTYF